MFDYKYGNLPISFADTWKLNSEIRNPSNIMALRNDNEYYVPFVRLDSFKRFPFSDFPRTWNELDSDEIKSTSSKMIFKKLLKEHFLSKLSVTITCDRMLCPSCHLQQLTL
jgi:hypothetical protein